MRRLPMNAFFGRVKGQHMAIDLLELQKQVTQYGAVVRCYYRY